MNQLSPSRATEILDRMRDQTVVIYGDVMLDEFVWGEVTRISPEAPVPVVDIRRESIHLGGAANVLANAIAIGARACLIGVIGDDSAGKRIQAAMRETGALYSDRTLIVEASRPSTLKTRIIAHNQLVVRADRELRTPVNSQIEDRIIGVLKEVLVEADALVVSDYDKGAVTPRILAEILPLARQSAIPAFIDPKIRNFDSYRPTTLVTPNHHEALRLTGIEDDGDDGIAEAARRIQERLGSRAVLITRGARGMVLLEEDRLVYVNTVAREVYDVTGAGDTVIATVSSASAAGASLLEAAMLANHAAGIVVSKVGTATASRDELIKSVNSNHE